MRRLQSKSDLIPFLNGLDGVEGLQRTETPPHLRYLGLAAHANGREWTFWSSEVTVEGYDTAAHFDVDPRPWRQSARGDCSVEELRLPPKTARRTTVFADEAFTDPRRYGGPRQDEVAGVVFEGNGIVLGLFADCFLLSYVVFVDAGEIEEHLSSHAGLRSA